jgi:hypothetical protein
MAASRLPPSVGGTTRGSRLSQEKRRSQSIAPMNSRIRIAYDCVRLTIVSCRSHAYSALSSCSRCKSSLMRCLTCGEEMVLAEAMPAEGEVQGFENQTHHCPACGATERRFMFVGGKTTFVAGRAETATLASAPHRMNVKLSRGVNGADKTAVNQPSGIKLFTVPAKQKSSAGHNGSTAFVGDVTKTKALTSEPPLAQEVRAPNGSNTSGQAWVRAVEKFRSYEADLYRRAENTKKRTGLSKLVKPRIGLPSRDRMKRALQINRRRRQSESGCASGLSEMAGTRRP